MRKIERDREIEKGRRGWLDKRGRGKEILISEGGGGGGRDRAQPGARNFYWTTKIYVKKNLINLYWIVLTIPLSLSLSHSLSLSLSPNLSLFFSLSLSLSLSVSLSLSHTHTHTLSLSHNLLLSIYLSDGPSPGPSRLPWFSYKNFKHSFGKLKSNIFLHQDVKQNFSCKILWLSFSMFNIAVYRIFLVC